MADGTGGHVFADTFEQHLKNVAHWRQIEKDAKDRLAPDATPLPAPSAIHGEIESVDPASFGALTAPDAGAAGAGRGSRPPRQDRRRPQRDGLRAGVAVAGVPGRQVDRRARRGRRGGQRLPRPRATRSPTPGPAVQDADSVASVPLPPAMLADQKAREAKYGTPVVAAAGDAASAPAAPQPPTASGRPRIYDASEGTKLDPLLNKTYDLSYAKVVPTLGQ